MKVKGSAKFLFYPPALENYQAFEHFPYTVSSFFPPSIPHQRATNLVYKREQTTTANLLIQRNIFSITLNLSLLGTYISPYLENKFLFWIFLRTEGTANFKINRNKKKLKIRLHL